MISTKSVWIAIFRILGDAGVTKGQAMTLSQLMQHWDATHLRQGDLARGLDTLSRAKLISLETSEQGPQVQLLVDSLNKAITPEEGERVVRSLDQLRFKRKAQRSTAKKLASEQAESSEGKNAFARRLSDAARKRT